MQAIYRQHGVTLIEVLVGFVIFTTSLVAVLNYVSEQIYHNHLSSTNLQKMEIIYDWSRIQQAGLDESRELSRQNIDFELAVVTSTTATTKTRDGEILLNDYNYSVADQDNVLNWVVFRIE